MGKKSFATGKKRKVVILFDEEARKEYLTGFRKRKEERKNKAKLEIERKLKTQINQERNKRRKITQEKVNKILKNVEMQCDDLDKSTTVDKVDFGSHEVLIKSDIEFSDTGLIITNKESENTLIPNPKPIFTKSKPKAMKRVRKVRGKQKMLNKNLKERKTDKKSRKMKR